MNQLPQELRTPPLPVVAFISCPELHKDIGTFFNANLRPPLFFVSLPEANESVLARLFGAWKCLLVLVMFLGSAWRELVAGVCGA